MSIAEELEYRPSFPEGYRPGIAIVGCGDIVRGSHLPSYARYGQRVVGVYDVRPEATAAVQERFGVEIVFDELAALLKHPDVEIVDVATHPDVGRRSSGRLSPRGSTSSRRSRSRRTWRPRANWSRRRTASGSGWR